jgi:hypothetical protein
LRGEAWAGLDAAALESAGLEELDCADATAARNDNNKRLREILFMLDLRTLELIL